MQNEGRKGADIEERLLDFAVELAKQLMPCRTRGWRDTSPRNLFVLELLRLPITPKHAQPKANATSFTSLELFSKNFEKARFGYA